MTSPSSPLAVRAPRQRRSQQTLERILDAVESLLEERRFDEISMQEIVRRARTSTGSLYARFPSKNALLPALYERYDARLEEETRRLRESEDWQALRLDEVIRHAARHVVRLYSRQRHLMRALTQFVRSGTEAIPGEAFGDRRRDQHRFLLDALLRHRDSIRHPRPERAVERGLFFVACIARDRLLFPDAPHARTTQCPERELVAELSRVLAGYLSLDLEDIA